MPDVRMTLDQGHWITAFRMADRIGSWMHFAQLRLWNAFRMPISHWKLDAFRSTSPLECISHAHRCPKLDRLSPTLDRECNLQVARCRYLCTCNEFMNEVG